MSESDNGGNLIPLTDEQAKLAQEVVKTFHDLGAFVGKALGSTPEDLVGYFGGDWLRARRAENMARLLNETKEHLAAMAADTEPATLSVALPILQAAADEDRDEIVDLWARLLANAMNPALRGVRYSFIEAVKKMDPLDALVLRHLYFNKITAIYPGDQVHENITVASEGQIASSLGIRVSALQVSILNLEATGFLRARGGSNSYISDFFMEFMLACFPE